MEPGAPGGAGLFYLGLAEPFPGTGMRSRTVVFCFCLAFLSLAGC